MADESSLPFFDRTATAAGGFPVGRRGYDKQAVDDYVRALEAQLAQTRNKVDELQSGSAPLQRQLDEAKRQLEASANPSYAGLGDRAAQILRLAQHWKRPSGRPTNCAPPPPRRPRPLGRPVNARPRTSGPSR